MEVLKKWRDEPFRRHSNERGVREDAAGFKLGGRLLLAYSLLFLLWREGQPAAGLAAANSLYALLLEALAGAIQRHRQLYVRYREAAILVAQVVQALVLVFTVCNNDHLTFDRHRGSSLSLLGSFLSGAPFFMAVTTLHARLVLSWNVWALPAVSLIPLAAAPHMCRRVLESEGVEAPLAGLFRLLDAVHVPRSPVAALVNRPLPPPPPLLACLAVNGWTLALCTVVLPLCMLHPLERRARRRFWVREAEAAQAAGSSEAAAAARREAAQQALVPTFPLTGVWALDIYLYSSLLWALAAAASTNQ